MPTNQQNQVYKNLVEAVNNLGESPVSNLEGIITKSFYLFSNGYNPSFYPESDFGKTLVDDLKSYSELVSKRRHIKIAEVEREVALETEAFSSLEFAEKLSENLLLPLFHKTTDISNKIFNDIHNLSLAYLNSIVNSVADEYVDPNSVLDHKFNSVDIAKKGFQLYEAYRNTNFSEDTKSALYLFKESLSKSDSSCLRPHELVATNPKHIYKSDIFINSLQEHLTERDSEGNFLFKPDVIIPVAHGGNEVGIKLSNAFESLGYSIPTYPILYSAKTRKHKYPWIAYDVPFLSSFKDKRVLITEDWVTTGHTLYNLLERLKEYKFADTRIATIKRDKEKSFIPELNDNFFYVGGLCVYEGKKGF